jgi:hypothetical protein
VIPVRTASSNFVYRGPRPDIGDAWVRREPGHQVYMVWQPSDEERAAIAAGANVELGIFMEPIPPVSLNVTTERALSADGDMLVERARGILRSLAPDGRVPAGFWAVGTTTWAELNRHGAVDTRGVPLLQGRPLMLFEEADPDLLQYEAST